MLARASTLVSGREAHAALSSSDDAAVVNSLKHCISVAIIASAALVAQAVLRTEATTPTTALLCVNLSLAIGASLGSSGPLEKVYERIVSPLLFWVDANVRERAHPLRARLARSAVEGIARVFFALVEELLEFVPQHETEEVVETMRRGVQVARDAARSKGIDVLLRQRVELDFPDVVANDGNTKRGDRSHARAQSDFVFDDESKFASSDDDEEEDDARYGLEPRKSF